MKNILTPMKACTTYEIQGAKIMENERTQMGFITVWKDSDKVLVSKIETFCTVTGQYFNTSVNACYLRTIWIHEDVEGEVKTRLSGVKRADLS